MQRPALFAACFLESFAVVLLERGVYFYTKDALGFSDTLNLWMGLVMGVTYAGGALASHGVAHRIGEKRLAVLALLGHLLLALAAMLWPSKGVMMAVYPVVGLLSGIYWPVIESYVTAGKTSRDMLRAVGRFCIAWSIAVPFGVAVTGLLVDSAWPESIFALTALCHLITVVCLMPLPGSPVHTPEDHPEQPGDERLTRYSALLRASRWSMLSGYALLFLLAPLLPTIFTERLALTNTVSTPLVALLDVSRVVAFALLMWMTFWYGRATPVLAAVVLMPVGFVLVLMSGSLYWVLLGEVLFGLTTGLVYYAALYYALAIKNAAVEAGGAHEALIGGGFALGPAAGLVGMVLARPMGDEFLGILVGASPLILLGLVGGMVPVIRLMWVMRRVG